jgi:transcriptional regulator with XRE-family HTH domain
MKLGRAIKYVRFVIGMSQGNLAKAVGLSQTYLSQIENEQKLPSLDTLESICKALEVPMFFLLMKAVEKDDIDANKFDMFEKFSPTISHMLEGLFLGDKKELSR